MARGSRAQIASDCVLQYRHAQLCCLGTPGWVNQIIGDYVPSPNDD